VSLSFHAPALFKLAANDKGPISVKRAFIVEFVALRPRNPHCSDLSRGAPIQEMRLES